MRLLSPTLAKMPATARLMAAFSASAPGVLEATVASGTSELRDEAAEPPADGILAAI